MTKEQTLDAIKLIEIEALQTDFHIERCAVVALIAERDALAAKLATLAGAAKGCQQ